jgi:hypothetical protein
MRRPATWAADMPARSATRCACDSHRRVGRQSRRALPLQATPGVADSLHLVEARRSARSDSDWPRPARPEAFEFYGELFKSPILTPRSALASGGDMSDHIHAIRSRPCPKIPRQRQLPPPPLPSLPPARASETCLTRASGASMNPQLDAGQRKSSPIENLPRRSGRGRNSSKTQRRSDGRLPADLTLLCNCLHCGPGHVFRPSRCAQLENEQMWVYPCTTCGGRGFSSTSAPRSKWQCCQCGHFYTPRNNDYRPKTPPAHSAGKQANGWFDDGYDEGIPTSDFDDEDLRWQGRG